MEAPPLVVLVGPTAVGKTACCLRICGELSAEVISADSVQVYRGLDAGSAKPNPGERKAVPHHLIDVAAPDENFDAARFMALADEAISEVTARGKHCLVAGGAGLYIRALIHGLAPAPRVDQGLRGRLVREWALEGPEAMHARLKEVDPAAAAKLHPNDRQRVLRALEVTLQTGCPFSVRQVNHGHKEVRYPCVYLGINRAREELWARIEARCRAMWDQGLVEEVKNLLAGGLESRARSLASLGYRQALAFICGEMNQEEALADMAAKTRAYAKRQLTWFSRLPGIHWFSGQDIDGVAAAAKEFWQGDAK